MSALIRNAPFRDFLRLHDELTRALDAGFRGVPGESENLGGWAPPVDIYEDAEGITLRAELPEVDPNAVDLRVENGTLTLKGERKLDREEKKENYRRIERFYGTFSRSFSLPPTVDTEKVRAEYKQGVLSVFLPRREETKPRQIRVKVES